MFLLQLYQRFFKSLLCLFFALVFLKAHSQTISNYSFSASAGTWSYIYNATSPSPTSAACNGEDVTASGKPIGFDFWYMGTKYTTFSVTTNGWMALGSSITDATANNLASGGTRPLLAPLWDNLYVSTLSSGNIYYRLTGTAPNRILTLEWYRVYWSTSRC